MKQTTAFLSIFFAFYIFNCQHRTHTPRHFFQQIFALTTPSFKLATIKLSLASASENKSRITTRWYGNNFFSPKLFRTL